MCFKSNRYRKSTVLSLLSTAVLTVIASACDSHQADEFPSPLVCTQQSQPGNLMPMEVGNFWQFEVTNFWNTPEPDVRIEILEKTDFTLPNGSAPIYASDIWNIGDPSPETVDLWQNQPGGTVLAGSIQRQDTIVVQGHFLPFPASLPTTTYFRSFDMDPDTGEYFVTDSTAIPLVSVNKVVETPAGTFTTYVFKLTIPASGDVSLGTDIFYHWAPGYGQVAREFRTEGEPESTPNSTTWLLKDFCLMAPENS